MLRESLAVAAVTIAVASFTSAPASAAFSQKVGTDRCNVTATGPTFFVQTLPNPGVRPDGALGASFYCPV